MSKLLISVVKFLILALLVGPLIAFFMVNIPMLFPLIILALIVLAILVWGVVYVSIKGIGWLSRTMDAPSLPRSIARSAAESRHYGRLIVKTVQQYPPGPMRDRLNLTIKPVDEWLARLSKLEEGLAKLYNQRNLTRELRQTTTELEALHRQSLMAVEQESVYLRALIESKKQHLAALKELQVFQTQAELKIRKIASDLATTHAEMLLLTTKGDFNDNRLSRLDENLQEHLAGLRDMLTAMDELGYSSSTV